MFSEHYLAWFVYKQAKATYGLSYSSDKIAAILEASKSNQFEA